MEIVKTQDNCCVLPDGCTISELMTILNKIKIKKGNLKVKVAADEDTLNFDVRIIDIQKDEVWLQNSM